MNIGERLLERALRQPLVVGAVAEDEANHSRHEKRRRLAAYADDRPHAAIAHKALRDVRHDGEPVNEREERVDDVAGRLAAGHDDAERVNELVDERERVAGLLCGDVGGEEIGDREAVAELNYAANRRNLWRSIGEALRHCREVDCIHLLAGRQFFQLERAVGFARFKCGCDC